MRPIGRRGRLGRCSAVTVAARSRTKRAASSVVSSAVVVDAQVVDEGEGAGHLRQGPGRVARTVVDGQDRADEIGEGDGGHGSELPMGPSRAGWCTAVKCV